VCLVLGSFRLLVFVWVRDKYCAVLRVGQMGESSTCTLKMLTKWIQSTRLETRTKESNIYASVKVRQTLARNESKGKFDLLRWEAAGCRGRTIDRSGFF